MSQVDPELPFNYRASKSWAGSEADIRTELPHPLIVCSCVGDIAVQNSSYSFTIGVGI